MIVLLDMLLGGCIRGRIVRRHKLCAGAVVLPGLVISLVAGVPGQCHGQERRSPVVEKRVERVLREYAHKSGAVGIAFGITQRGTTVLECYSGYASRADERRVDASSVFCWASLSKGLTAVCALKMAEQGDLDLDADIKEYIPELDLRAPVTLRQLLCHQGGIGGYETYPELFELKKADRQLLSQQAILGKLAEKQTVFAPGSRLGYSSPGYILLSIAMERASKKSFSEIVDELVARPLKLSSLRVGGVGEADVIGYELTDGKPQFIEESNNDWRLGAGAVRSNLPDALAFASSLIQSSILTPASSKELFKRRAMVKSEDDEEAPASYTYGFMRIGVESDAAIAAAGMQSGARSLMVIYPRQQMASVIFANTTPLELERIQLAAMEALAEE